MSSLSAFAGSIPANYDKFLGPLLFEPYALDLAERLKGRRLCSVLELACGTGRVTAHLAKLLEPDGKLVATDLNPDMIEVARRQVTASNIEWKVVDAQELPFEAGSFDHIVCQYGVMFFPDKRKAFSEAFRVLQQGGLYLFNTWDDIRNNPRINAIRTTMEDMYANESPEFFRRGPYAFYDREEIQALMEEAGFRNVRIEMVQKVTNYQNEEEIRKGFLEGSTLAAYMKDKDESQKEKLHQRVRSALIEQEAVYGTKVPLQAFVCSGEKK
jgi:ubiquinone/menaquinone biosynthesis C-methylase UbiE